MATISSLGAGSGLDLSGMLSKLQTVENLPLQAIQKQQSSFNTKLSAYSSLKGLLETVQTAANKLADPALFSTNKATSSVADVLGVSADTTAVAGSYAVSVTQLAQAQSLTSAAQTNNAKTFGTGTVTITLASDASFNVAIDGSNNTLSGLRDAINASAKAANVNVGATIVNNGSGNMLVLTSATGTNSAVASVSVNGDAALGDLLAYDGTEASKLTQAQAAADARLNVNGIPVTSSSNEVKGAIQGVTLNLLKTGSSEVALSRDAATPQAAVEEFVKAYNAVQAKIADLSKYDSASKTAGALSGDYTVRSIQSRLSSLLFKEQSGDFKTLSAIGITQQKDGTLKIGADTFNKATLAGSLASNPAGVAQLFGSAAGSSTGIAKEMSALITSLTATGGQLKNATEGINTTLTRLSRDLETTQARIDAKMARYRTQFQALDTLVSNMNGTSSYLTQQFAQKSS